MQPVERGLSPVHLVHRCSHWLSVSMPGAGRGGGGGTDGLVCDEGWGHGRVWLPLRGKQCGCGLGSAVRNGHERAVNWIPEVPSSSVNWRPLLVQPDRVYGYSAVTASRGPGGEESGAPCRGRWCLAIASAQVTPLGVTE